MLNKLIEKLNTRQSIYSVVKSMLPHPKYWPKKLHEIRLDRYYFEEFGKHVDFRNPKTFNEKIMWYMIYFTDETATTVTDKIQFKKFISEKLGEGYTAELYGVWDNAADIDFADLPIPCVLKSNCSGDGGNIAVITDKSQLTDELRNRMRAWTKWQNTFINSSSNAYFSIKPKILAEEYFENTDKQLIDVEELTDYKFFCFDGIPHCIYTSVRFKPLHKITIYDMEWNALDIQYGNRDNCPVPKPEHFDDMVRIASVLSEGFPFIRVDFYETTKGLKVGEMTYDSGGGIKSFTPDAFDYELGAKFVLPSKKQKT